METLIVFSHGLYHQSIRVLSCIVSIYAREVVMRKAIFLFLCEHSDFFIWELCYEKHSNWFMSGKCGGVLKTRFTLFSVHRRIFLFADFSCGFYVYVYMTKLRFILETKKTLPSETNKGLLAHETKQKISSLSIWNGILIKRNIHVISCIFWQKK